MNTNISILATMDAIMDDLYYKTSDNLIEIKDLMSLKEKEIELYVLEERQYISEKFDKKRMFPIFIAYEELNRLMRIYEFYQDIIICYYQNKKILDKKKLFNCEYLFIVKFVQ